MVWYEATEKIEQLHQQGRYSEAAKVAKEALRCAEFQFGEKSPFVAFQLGRLAETLARLADEKRNLVRGSNGKHPDPVNG